VLAHDTASPNSAIPADCGDGGHWPNVCVTHIILCSGQCRQCMVVAALHAMHASAVMTHALLLPHSPQILSGKSIKFTDMMSMHYTWEHSSDEPASAASSAVASGASSGVADFDDIAKIARSVARSCSRTPARSQAV
jgi:hypothetical protein